MSSKSVSFSSVAVVMAMVIVAGCDVDTAKEISPVPAGEVQVRLSGATIEGSPARSTLEVDYKFLSGTSSARKKYFLVIDRANGNSMFELELTTVDLDSFGTVMGQFVGPSLIGDDDGATARLEMADRDDSQRTCISNTITVSVRK